MSGIWLWTTLFAVRSWCSSWQKPCFSRSGVTYSSSTYLHEDTRTSFSSSTSQWLARPGRPIRCHWRTSWIILNISYDNQQTQGVVTFSGKTCVSPCHPNYDLKSKMSRSFDMHWYDTRAIIYLNFVNPCNTWVDNEEPTSRGAVETGWRMSWK